MSDKCAKWGLSETIYKQPSVRTVRRGVACCARIVVLLNRNGCSKLRPYGFSAFFNGCRQSSFVAYFFCPRLSALCVVWHCVVCEDEYQVKYIYYAVGFEIAGFCLIPIGIALGHSQELQREREVVEIDDAILV